MKKAQSMNLLWIGISILIFIILFFSGISWGSDLLSGAFGSSRLEDQRDLLIESANNALSSDEKRFLLRLPSNSAIIIMNPQSGFEFVLSDQEIKELPHARGYLMNRPLSCEPAETCVCSCSNVNFRPGFDNSYDSHITCNELRCVSTDFKIEESISNTEILSEVDDDREWSGVGEWRNSFILLKHPSIGDSYDPSSFYRQVPGDLLTYITAGYQKPETYQLQDSYEFRVKKVGDDTVRFCLKEDC